LGSFGVFSYFEVLDFLVFSAKIHIWLKKNWVRFFQRTAVSVQRAESRNQELKNAGKAADFQQAVDRLSCQRARPNAGGQALPKYWRASTG